MPKKNVLRVELEAPEGFTIEHLRARLPRLLHPEITAAQEREAAEALELKVRLLHSADARSRDNAEQIETQRRLILDKADRSDVDRHTDQIGEILERLRFLESANARRRSKRKTSNT